MKTFVLHPIVRLGHHLPPLRVSLTLACLGICTLADAQTIPLVTINVNTTSVVRSDISRATFGSGVEHQTPQFRTLMDQVPTSDARTAIQNTQIGTLRFPNGTAGSHYIWDAPSWSYTSNPAVPASAVLTPTEAYSYTNQLGMERLFQVNTYFYRKSGSIKYINANGTNSSIPPVINTTNLTEGAQYGADWVANNLNSQAASARVNYWEVGNEDWARWTPEQYAQIFNAYSTKMKVANPNIKLLAQTLNHSYTTGAGIVNGNDWTDRLVSGGINTSDVYALSYHRYYSGGQVALPNDPEGTRVNQTLNMLADVSNSYELIDLKNRIQNLGLPWKIWTTEFNINQTDANGTAVKCQDLGHALVVADNVGRMLQLGVERIFMHSLDHNPYYSIVDYVNSGGTIDNAITTVPGYAFSIYPQKFGSKMVNNTLTGNPQISSPTRGNMAQISVYSSVMSSTTDPRLRMVIVNRSWNTSAQLKIQTTGTQMRPAPATFNYSRLYSAKVSHSNVGNKDFVKWTAPTTYNSNSWALENIVIPAHSVNYLDIPLQPSGTQSTQSALSAGKG